MLERIEFENFRCFENTKLNIRDLTIIVGKNNSGKSTIIEALRIISMASKKYKKTVYIQPPPSLNLPASFKGFKLKVDKLKIDLRGIVYFYGEGYAKITAYFRNKTKIAVYLNNSVAFAMIYDKDKKMVNTKALADSIDISTIEILPQIGLIKDEEELLSENTVTKDIDTYLSSRHFRNELLLYKQECFYDFKAFSEETWHDLKIIDLIYNKIESDNISLLVEDARFPAEIGNMGSGIQMWLQIIWFLCKSKGSETIILDEPDVYMHPDLQLKLLKLVRKLFKQIIIATHSVEIISNVPPRNIVMIDKKNRRMLYANHLKGVQNIIDDIGSIYNLSLVRLSNAKKCIFVEGKDLKILQQFYNVLYPDNTFSLETIPTLPLGGFTRINEAFGASKLFHKSTENNFKCFAILDRDYYSDTYIDEIYKKAEENHLILYIWDRKEIENFLIIPKVIFKITGKPSEKYEQFIVEYEELVDTFKESTIHAYTDKIAEDNKSLTASTARKKAQQYVDAKWTSLDEKLKLVSGKELLKRTNDWIKQKYKKSCSMRKYFEIMKPTDIDQKIKEVINDLIEI